MITKEEIKKAFQSYQRVQLPLNDFPGFSRAGVLVPLFPRDRELHVLLTLRTESVETHKGQISFPGGMMDTSDRDIVDTALREACEEIGLHKDELEILGILDDVPVPTGFLITPVVSYLPARPVLRVNQVEVAEVFEAPLMFFADDRNARYEDRELRGYKHVVWFYDYQGKTIWGATAAILRTLVKMGKPLRKFHF